LRADVRRDARTSYLGLVISPADGNLRGPLIILVIAVPVENPYRLIDIEEQLAAAFGRHDRFKIVGFGTVIGLQDALVAAGRSHPRDHLERFDKEVAFQRPKHRLPETVYQTQIGDVDATRADSDMAVHPRVWRLRAWRRDTNSVFLALLEPNAGALADRIRSQDIVDFLQGEIHRVRANLTGRGTNGEARRLPRWRAAWRRRRAGCLADWNAVIAIALKRIAFLGRTPPQLATRSTFNT
jgi:hypothetical protein